MYRIWYFATGDQQPRHIATHRMLESCWGAVVSEFGFEWYGPEWDKLACATGGQVLCERNDVHGAGVLVCVVDPRP